MKKNKIEIWKLGDSPDLKKEAKEVKENILSKKYKKFISFLKPLWMEKKASRLRGGKKDRYKGKPIPPINIKKEEEEALQSLNSPVLVASSLDIQFSTLDKIQETPIYNSEEQYPFESKDISIEEENPLDDEETPIDESVKEIFDEFEEETTLPLPTNYHPASEIYKDNSGEENPGEEKLAESGADLRIVPSPNFSYLKNFIPEQLIHKSKDEITEDIDN
jgi:hypothetical protein